MDNKIKLFFKKRISEPSLMEKLEYDEFEKIFKEKYLLWTLPIIEDIKKFININQKYIILDAACGPGYLTKALALNFNNSFVYGLDYSNYIIKKAKKNCLKIKNVKFVVRNIENTGFRDNFFDLIICKDSFHHFKNPKLVIKEMMRILKEEGIFYIQDLKRDVPWYILSTVVPPDNIRKKLIYYSVRASYTPKEISVILRKLNIKNFVIKIRKLDKKRLNIFKTYKVNINPLEIRMYFRSRFIVIIKKK